MSQLTGYCVLCRAKVHTVEGPFIAGAVLSNSLGRFAERGRMMSYLLMKVKILEEDSARHSSLQLLLHVNKLGKQYSSSTM